jgi:Right handed beta helix region
MKTFSYAMILLLCFALPARAVNVYAGCAAPTATPGQIWYIDPVNGKTQAAGGNGSQASPWNNLQALVQAEPGYSYPLLTTAPYRQVPVPGQPAVTKTGPNAGPVAPGDEIVLMSGNYGNVAIGGLAAEISNSDFVTVVAAPGQTPVLTSLFIGETNKWVFDGLKVQSLEPAALSGNALLQIKDGGATFPTSDIVLENMSISSQDDASGWSQAQWVANARNGFSALGTDGGANTSCISFTGSHITNVRAGAGLFADQLVFANNEIDHFGDDGLDYGASNLAITRNNIHDNLNIGDGNHEDAMQGQIGVLAPGATVNYFQNVLIDSNLIIRQTDPELAFPTYLQGIDAFDSDWTNMTVSNNVVVTSACWGMSFASMHNGLVINNTVSDDGLVSLPCGVAYLAVNATTHEGLPSTNTIVRNNLTSALGIGMTTGIEADHNVIMSDGKQGAVLAYLDASGGVVYIGGAGTYTLLVPGSTNNVIDGLAPGSEFSNWNPATLTFNVLLKPGAPAIGAGTSTGAPTVDIAGVTRAAPYTVGAYSYPY